MIDVAAKYIQLTFWPWVPPWPPRRRRRPPVMLCPPIPPSPPPPAPPPPPKRPPATLAAIEALLERCRKFEASVSEDTSGWNPNIVLLWHLEKAREAAEAFEFEMRLAGCGDAHLHKPPTPGVQGVRLVPDGQTGQAGRLKWQVPRRRRQ